MTEDEKKSLADLKAAALELSEQNDWYGECPSDSHDGLTLTRTIVVRERFRCSKCHATWEV